jgi:hypothetical protein
MNRQSTYAARLGVLLLATVVVLAGCKSASPAAQATQGASTPTPAITATSAPLPTTAPTATEVPGSTDTPSATAVPVPTTAPSATPVASAAPSSVAGMCTGTADHQAFFADAAAKLPFDAYCAVLPAGWWLATANYQQPNGGLLVVGYKNNAGATVEISEGNFCTTPATCWAVVTTIGTGKFGPLSGTLVTASATPVYGIYVGANTTHSYVITGQGMTQAKFVAIAAALAKVPKA